ncbi:MAG: peptidase, partial [Calditrichaeota bacterium]
AKNPEIQQALISGNNPDFPVLLEYFNICFGPFDRLENNEPFINLTNPKPPGANYYPEDMSREEFEKWITDHPEDENEFISNFTVIRRKGNNLVAIPYSEVYKEELTAAAELLKSAASRIRNSSVKTYLNSRADAFLSNDYFQSDIDWMDLKDHTLEIVVGPYEVYEDKLFGYKAAFEAFVTLVDPVESEKLYRVSGYLDEMEKNLPIPDKYKNTRRGSSSPIVVVQEVFTAGDTKAGIQTTAFNLPNDERVREARGSKKVMLKNIAQAKFDKCWIPIVKEVIHPDMLPSVNFDAYFNHVLMHEMSHGLGPGTIIKNGDTTSVSAELKETYTTIEEAKADILGLYNTQFLIDRNLFPASLEKETYITYLGGIFRSIRFGITSAHGGANAVIYNYIGEKGGFEYDRESMKFSVNLKKIKSAVKDLAHDLLIIQAEGNYKAAKDFMEKYRYLPDELQSALTRLITVPVDIRPIYAIEREMAGN